MQAAASGLEVSVRDCQTAKPAGLGGAARGAPADRGLPKKGQEKPWSATAVLFGEPARRPNQPCVSAVRMVAAPPAKQSTPTPTAAAITILRSMTVVSPASRDSGQAKVWKLTREGWSIGWERRAKRWVGCGAGDRGGAKSEQVAICAS